jgi:type II secretory pathway component GspD/PulD (secretin)
VTRPLRYISAADVLPVLVQALTEPGGNAGGGAEGGGAPTGGRQQAQTRPPSGGGGFDQNGGGTQGFTEELSTQAVDTTPRAVTIGNAKLIADQRANAIIILGNREVVLKVSKILDEMDIKAPQVILSTVIGELELDKNEEFGVDYFQKRAGLSGPNHNSGIAGWARNNAKGPLADPNSLLSFQQIATTIANQVSTGGTTLALQTGFGLTAIVSMLDSTGRFKVLNRPTVFTSNNKKAIIASGEEIPVPVSTLSTINNTSVLPGQTPFNNFGTQSSIQYKKVALQLEVVPLINSEKEVTLDILQKLDSVSGQQQIDNNNIPTITTRYIKTNVSAPNGSTLILGGLITDNRSVSKSGIPVISHIPLVGALFRETVRSGTRKELIILMRPEVALTKLDLYRLRQKHEDNVHLGPELDQDDCPDCPKTYDGKQTALPPPDLPGTK